MTKRHSKSVSPLVVGAAVVWVVAFLILFFTSKLPNASTADRPIFRSDVWQAIFSGNGPTLNPFDYPRETGNSGWEYFGERLPFIGVATCLLFAAWCLGKVTLERVLSACNLMPSERLVISLGGGLSLLSLWILLCGVAGHLDNVALILTPSCVAVVALLVDRLLIRSEGRSLGTAANQPASTHDSPPIKRRVYLFFGVLFAPFALHIFLGGMTPPFDFDVREYHLQGPKEWFQEGRITTLQHNVYTSFPFLSESISLGAMVLHQDWWKGAIAGKLTLSGFQFLTALSLYGMCRRHIGIVPGLIAAVAFMSTPWTTRISIIAYAEGALTFFVTATVMLALLSVQSAETKSRLRLIGATGFMAGSAMAAKYPGILSAVLPIGLFLAVNCWNRIKTTDGNSNGLKRFSTEAFVYVAMVVVAVGPWLIRNTVSEGNPVYPLAYSVFGADDWSPEMDAKWKKAHSAPEHSVSRIPQHLASVSLRNDWQSGFLFACALPTLIMIRRTAWARFLWLYAIWFLTTWWALTHRIDRFWVPLIPVVAILAGGSWALSTSRIWRLTVGASLSVCCLFNYGFCRTDLIGFHAGLTEMETSRHQAIRADIRLLNSTLPQNSKVLMVGEAEVFDATFDLVYCTVFDENTFEKWTSIDSGPPADHQNSRLKSLEDIRTIFRKNGITHVYVNWSEVLRYRLTYGFTDFVTPKRFVDLQSAGILQPSRTLSTGDWLSRSDQERNEILSWDNGDTLMYGTDYWTPIQLYKVNN